ncbi:MAG: tRNA (adenosine(37)-N6)-threonylcarbamoyltransferase complex ATPase subunit type 1 TsaE [Hyphomicrobiaceae bacterium]|nr:tRNA (adenosine(37)-N6)-threonylcarbamoyltransferase complex ATPase subunit type 1 TsaE [Hyphomicrobiaceae bacterium]
MPPSPSPAAYTCHLTSLDEPGLERLAARLAFSLRRGDLVALVGDLGAGKTTLARCLIRHLAEDPALDIPSPTFTLVQTYATPRLAIAHLDLYRLSDPAEVDELGLEALLTEGAVIVEWAERAGAMLPADRLEIALSIAEPDETRDLTLHGTGAWATRLSRFEALDRLVDAAGWNRDGDRFTYMDGDASSRRYARLTRPTGKSAVLMDWPRQPDGPPLRNGKPYSRIAHLAEDVGAFLAVAHHLAAHGIPVPAILASDLDAGFLLISDLGTQPFATALLHGVDQSVLWSAAVDTLVAMVDVPAPNHLPVAGERVHDLAAYDTAALAIEIDLVATWFWPLAFSGAPCPEAVREDLHRAFAPLLAEVAADRSHMVLRDFHSPNLLWRPEQQGLARVGVIDFQDALRGPAAYDLVSLLQDARLDVAPDLERTLLDGYCRAAEARHPTFDPVRFRRAYAILGVQRATKIIGIFARLWLRDGKPRYLAHLPRIWGYLERNLTHPALAGVAAWYDTHIPGDQRRREHSAIVP